MSWIYLLIAGVFELGFTTCLKFAEGFSKGVPSLLVLLFGGLSLWCLSQALHAIPLGTAYAVWTGIGAFGTAVVGMVFFNEPASGWRLFFLCTLIASILGLKVVAGE